MADAFAVLIPELPKWNNGAGIEPKAWIECVGNYELAELDGLISILEAIEAQIAGHARDPNRWNRDTS